MTLLFNPKTGNSYRSSTPVETTRLLARGYYEQPSSEPVSAAYDPGEHNVADVLAYIEEHPEQGDIVVAAERVGKNRSTIVGSE